jgi:hypothetical protein
MSATLDQYQDQLDREVSLHDIQAAYNHRCRYYAGLLAQGIDLPPRLTQMAHEYNDMRVLESALKEMGR